MNVCVGGYNFIRSLKKKKAKRSSLGEKDNLLCM